MRKLFFITLLMIGMSVGSFAQYTYTVTCSEWSLCENTVTATFYYYTPRAGHMVTQSATLSPGESHTFSFSLPYKKATFVKTDFKVSNNWINFTVPNPESFYDYIAPHCNQQSYDATLWIPNGGNTYEVISDIIVGGK